MSPAPRHLYVHVPFCRERCDYCEFDSEAVGVGAAGDRFEAYLDALHVEWALERTRWGVERIETVYVGGGTPSLLGEERLERLLEPLEPLLTPKAEVTVETNPEDVTPGYAAWAAARGLRLSLGVQSFDRRLRENLGRRTLADPAAAFAALRRAGVADLGVDLIFGIPGQAIVDVTRELEVVAALRPDHVSWYELTVAEGTALAARLELTGAGRLGWDAPEPPGDDAQAEMYRRIVAGLERVGYHWYEVSNFARPGRRCRHNGAYWRGRDFLGLGPGAVSTVGDTRWCNDAGAKPYGDALLSPGAIAPPRSIERLDGPTRARERLLLAARTGAPVPLAEIEAALDRAALEPLTHAGFVSVRGGTLRVTRKGRYVASEVCVRLFRASSS